MDDNEYETYDADEYNDAEFEEELKKHEARVEAEAIAAYGGMDEDEEEHEDDEEDGEREEELTVKKEETVTSISPEIIAIKRQRTDEDHEVVKVSSSNIEEEEQPKPLSAFPSPSTTSPLSPSPSASLSSIAIKAGPSTSQQSTTFTPLSSTSFLAPIRPPLQPFPYDEPVIHNIVATANYCVQLDLNQLVVKIRNSEYNPKRFRAVIMRIYEPRTTMMLFSSGKVVVTGAKSDREACTAARKCCRILQLVGYQTKFTEFKIQNIVSTVDVKFPIRLDKLSHVHTQFCTYDPDFFPALIYRMVRPRTVLLVFVSGKIILTGAKSRQEIHDTMEKMAPVLATFRKL